MLRHPPSAELDERGRPKLAESHLPYNQAEPVVANATVKSKQIIRYYGIS